jgi:hypothetical protein
LSTLNNLYNNQKVEESMEKTILGVPVRLALALFIAAIMVAWAIMVGFYVAKADPYDGPGMATPAPQPALPTYVTNGDGSRMDCAPNFTVCWPSKSQATP